MKLRHLTLQNFARYESLDLDFPDNLFLLVGSNGAGKSTIPEAICWTLYGQLIRGRGYPARSGTTASTLTFEVGGQDWAISRKRSGGKNELRLFRSAQDVSGQTPTETQAKIDGLLGPWDRFVATHVFARDFMTRFAVATDKDRKAMLEGFLGLGRFDDALSACRTDRSLQDNAAAGAKAALEAQRDALIRQQAAFEALPPEADHRALEAELEKLEKEYIAADDSYQRLKTAADQAEKTQDRTRQTAFRKRHECELAIKEKERLLEAKTRTLATATCPVCFRQMKGAENAVEAHFMDEVAALDPKIAQVTKELDDLNADLKEQEAEFKALRESVAEARAKLPNTDALKRLRNDIATARVQAGERIRRTAELEESKRIIAEKERESVLAQERATLLREVDRVLGLRGARTLLLGRALGRLEDETNAALRELGLGLQVGISGTTQLKSKKEVEAIDIELIGAGEGAYEMSSTGERARVDVAFLMGLAGMAGATGFLAFDEVFDSLDPEGVSLVAQYLDKLAQQRQVIVISHHADLKSEFPRGVTKRAVKDGDGSHLEAA